MLFHLFKGQREDLKIIVRDTGIFKNQSLVFTVTGGYLLNNFKHIIFLEPWKRRRPSLYADTPVDVLQVTTGEQGGRGGLSNLLK